MGPELLKEIRCFRLLYYLQAIINFSASLGNSSRLLNLPSNLSLSGVYAAFFGLSPPSPLGMDQCREERRQA